MSKKLIKSAALLSAFVKASDFARHAEAAAEAAAVTADKAYYAATPYYSEFEAARALHEKLHFAQLAAEAAKEDAYVAFHDALNAEREDLYMAQAKENANAARRQAAAKSARYVNAMADAFARR